jgi:phospholipase C
MISQTHKRKWFDYAFMGSLIFGLAGSTAASAAAATRDAETVTPIKHVVVIIGENRSFDHVFGAYQPRPGQTVSNSLSKGIINLDGSPGPNFMTAAQYQALVTSTYLLS